MTGTAPAPGAPPAAPPAPAGPAPAAPDGAATLLPVLWSLNGLRAVGALLVMLYHINSWNLQVVRGSSAGFTGVGLFFVLSGFVLTWTARPGTTVGTFYRRRLARILPNHVVTWLLGLAIAVVLLEQVLDPTTALVGLLLLQAWSPDAQLVFAVNGVTWSLSCEIAFYVAFPLLLWGLRRLRPRTRTAVAVGALAVPPLVGVLWPATIPLLFHLPPARLPEFVLGMVTAMAVQEGWRPRVPAPVLLGLLAVGILGAAAVTVHPTVLTAALAVVFAPLAARCAWGDIHGGNRWARHPAVVVAGALSFSFYLLHELVIKMVLVTPLRGPGTIPLVLVVSAALAFGLYRGVEVPVRARLLAGSRQPRPSLAELGAAAHSPAERRPRHSRPRSAAWSFPVPATAGPAVALAVAAPPAGAAALGSAVGHGAGGSSVGLAAPGSAVGPTAPGSAAPGSAAPGPDTGPAATSATLGGFGTPSAPGGSTAPAAPAAPIPAVPSADDARWAGPPSPGAPGWRPPAPPRTPPPVPVRVRPWAPPPPPGPAGSSPGSAASSGAAPADGAPLL